MAIAELATVRRSAPNRAAKFPKQPDLGENLEAVLSMVYSIWLICIVETLRLLRFQIIIRTFGKPSSSAAATSSSSSSSSSPRESVVRVNTPLLRKWRRTATKNSLLQDLIARRQCSRRKRLLSRYSSSLESITEE